MIDWGTDATMRHRQGRAALLVCRALPRRGGRENLLTKDAIAYPRANGACVPPHVRDIYACQCPTSICRHHAA